MNVALYTKRASAWTLQERAIQPSDRSATGVTIGNSTMSWQGDRLVVTIDERTSPFGRPVRGRVVLHPEARPGVELDIDARGEHRWWPVAPTARIEVDLLEPSVRFTGHGYHDANTGAGPLEDAFHRWSWSRARHDGDAFVTYTVTDRNLDERAFALKIGKDGTVVDLARTWAAPLPRTVWGLQRQSIVDQGAEARLVRSLEDGPFYARALVETRLDGHRVLAVHEELAAHRLRSPLVRLMTRCRMRTVR